MAVCPNPARWGTSVRLERYISALPKDKMFTTRDVLHLGKRASIDGALSRLVNAGQLVRIVRGVFKRPRADGSWTKPSFVEVAQVKAQSFGRKIISHGQDAAKRLALTEKGNSEIVFATDGYSSKFAYDGKYISFRRVSSRKFCLGEKQPGVSLRAFCHVGARISSKKELVKKMLLTLVRSQRIKARELSASVPSWLSDQLMWIELPLNPIFRPQTKPRPSVIKTAL